MFYPLRFRIVEYNIPHIILTILVFLGALSGAMLSAAGVYILAKSVLDFAYYEIPCLMVVLGIMAIYAASVGTDGVLYGGQGHMQPLMLVVFLVLLGEAWVLLSASMEPLVVKNELHMMWKKTFYDNRRRLSWLESYYGCCGFKNSTDMPSSEKCSMLSGSLAQKPRGCMELMRQDVFHNNKLALEWCLFAVIAQLVVVAFGYGLYKRVYEIDTTWIVENTDDIEAAQEEGGISWNAPPAEIQHSEAAQDDVRAEASIGAGGVADIAGNDQSAVPGSRPGPEPEPEPEPGSEPHVGPEYGPEPEPKDTDSLKKEEANTAASTVSGTSEPAKSKASSNPSQIQKHRGRGKNKRR